MTGTTSGGIVAIVLAAGASSRMGEQKLLLPLGGQRMVARVTERVAGCGVDEIVVVLGRDGERVRDALKGLTCRFVQNPRYLEGMGTSVRAALDSLDRDVRAVLLVLADQPFVTTTMLRTLLETYERDVPLAVISRFGDVIAPPHVFDRALFSNLGLPGSEGAKDLLHTHRDRCGVVDFPMSGLFDVDDPDDYRRAIERAERERQGA